MGELARHHASSTKGAHTLFRWSVPPSRWHHWQAARSFSRCAMTTRCSQPVVVLGRESPSKPRPLPPSEPRSIHPAFTRSLLITFVPRPEGPPVPSPGREPRVRRTTLIELRSGVTHSRWRLREPRRAHPETQRAAEHAAASPEESAAPLSSHVVSLNPEPALSSARAPSTALAPA